ncbi:hypothetical protein QUF72_15680, partial [Desulfobacterales bacterium HSG2]|nr:hypothetical protein [Desulfobacterales bacterium HSG2]
EQGQRTICKIVLHCWSPDLAIRRERGGSGSPDLAIRRERGRQRVAGFGNPARAGATNNLQNCSTLLVAGFGNPSRAEAACLALLSYKFFKIIRVNVIISG